MSNTFLPNITYVARQVVGERAHGHRGMPERWRTPDALAVPFPPAEYFEVEGWRCSSCWASVYLPMPTSS